MKSNDSLYFAVLTGCLRVAKESIFTGLNNPKMYTLLDARCDEQFGFTDAEVRQMLEYYGLSAYYDVTKEWYDGYRIASASVYNPWDVINWCDQLLTNPDKTPKSFWKNSSSNNEVRRFIRRMGDGVTKAQIERLISGDTVRKKITEVVPPRRSSAAERARNDRNAVRLAGAEEQLTYNTIYDNIENMWSLLFATGYLTSSENSAGNMVELKIPNNEVRDIFSDFILELFEEKVAENGEAVTEFCTALKDGDVVDVERLFTKFMSKTISIRDTVPSCAKRIGMDGTTCRRAERGGATRAVRKEYKENFYHGLILGILFFKNDWDVSSNRESGAAHREAILNGSADLAGAPSGARADSRGDGYYDIAIEIEDEGIGIIIEVKYAEEERYEDACTEAMDQINKTGYTMELKEDGMWKILKYGIACYRKQCRVVLEREEG